MIHVDDFTDQFVGMASLLNKTANKNQLDHWYKKIQLFDSAYLSETCDYFVELDKFPTWSQFRKAYKKIEASHGGKKKIGCEYCQKGFVSFWKKQYAPRNPFAKDKKGPRQALNGGLELEWAIRCVHCNPDRFGNGYDGHANPAKLKILDFKAGYPYGQFIPPRAEPEPPPLKPQSVAALVAATGTQINAPAKGQEFKRKLSLDRDLEDDIRSARESDGKEEGFPWF